MSHPNPPWIVYKMRGKDAPLSARARASGNDAFRQAQWESAAHFYTDAICLAPLESAELGAAYGNRSAALFELAQWRACIDDISCALALPAVSPGAHEKLLRRRDACKKDSFDSQDDALSPEAVSSNIATRITADEGRFLVAGDAGFQSNVVLVDNERPLACVANEGAHVCWSCLSSPLCLIPCDRCRHARFCSVACRAASAYHESTDCASAPPLSPRLRLAARLLFEFPSVDWSASVTLSHDAHELRGSAAAAALARTSRTDPDVAPVAAYLRASLPDYERDISAQLLGALQRVDANAFAVRHRRSRSRGALESAEDVAVGIATYALSSLFNHACAPNCAATFTGGCISVRTTRRVVGGDALTVSYGPLASREPTDARKAALSDRYGFSCRCAACAANAPASALLLRCPRGCSGAVRPPAERHAAIACASCGGELDASVAQVLRDGRAHTRGAQQALQKGNTEGALAEARAGVALLAAVLHPSCLAMGEAYDIMAQCFVEKGSFREAADAVEKSIIAAVEAFGEGSLEVEAERAKLHSITVHL